MGRVNVVEVAVAVVVPGARVDVMVVEVPVAAMVITEMEGSMGVALGSQSAHCW